MFKYVIDLQLSKSVCLVSHGDDKAWLWRARFSHLSIDAPRNFACNEMVCGLPRVEHEGELCNSCLAGKQRRAIVPKDGDILR